MSDQSRSASVSTLGDQRSSSFNGNLFQNPSVPYYNQKDALDVSLDASLDLVDPALDIPDLDIVDALGTLNIDDVPDLALQPADTSVSSDLANVSASSKLAANVLDTHETLTPNPPPLAAFRAPNTIGESDSTPSSKWGNTFVPFSAPPFAYPVADPVLTSQMAMLIAPFALPDEKISSNAGTPNLNYKHERSSIAAASPQPGRQFGGILNLRMPFDAYGAAHDNVDFSRLLPKKGSPDGSNLSDDKAADKHLGAHGRQEFADMSFYNHLDAPLDVFAPPSILSGVNLWNQKQLFPMQNNNTLGSVGYSGDAPGQMDRGAFAGNYHPYSRNATNVHNQGYGANHGPSQGPPAGPHQHNQIHNPHPGNAHAHAHAHSHVHNLGGNGETGAHNHDSYGYNNRHQNDFIGMNSRVNVHRKMHNNRKKGDMATKYANASLEDFTGDIFSLCKDQHGCRFLQRQLDLSKENRVGETSIDDGASSDMAATMIFNEIHTKIVELMVDPFGNYLVQKLFESVSSPQRLVLVRNAAPEFIRIALDPHGTRALQKLVEQISSSDEARYIIDSLSPHVVSLSRDLNGNHVVQKCLQRLSAADNQFIFDAAANHCSEIATHRHGCCVLQRCLDHGNSKQREQLLLKVAEIATTLSLDPYGNYVVQYVLSRGDERSIAIILDHIRANIVSLSLHKFGSNVIEKTLRTRRLSDLVIDVLLENSGQLLVLLNDPYGNYVLQTALDVASAANLNRLAQSLQPLLPSIKNTPHGRRIFTKIQHIL